VKWRARATCGEAFAALSIVAALAALMGCRTNALPPAGDWIDLLGPHAGISSESASASWSAIDFGGSGEIEPRERGVRLHAGSPMTGVSWRVGTAEVLQPMGSYELEVEAVRVAGNDFFCALTFPVGDACLTLVLGGWGGSTCGLSCLDGLDAANNRTTTYHRFEKGRAYRARVVVTPARVAAFVDDAPLCSVDLAGLALSLRTEVEPCRPLGVASYATTADLLSARWRPLPRGLPIPDPGVPTRE